MKSDVLVTIGMPVYNGGDVIASSIESVLEQDWTGKFEILIIDDGSKDHTGDVLEKYRYDNRVRVIKHHNNIGRPFARNTIIKEARGVYLTWIDADDTWTSDKLRLQLEALAKYSFEGDRAISLCSYSVRWKGKKPKYRANKLGHDDIASVLDASIPAYLWTMLCRTEFYRAVGGFDERLLRLQDTDIVIRLLKFGCYFVAVDDQKSLVTYNKSDHGKSGKLVFQCMNIIYNKHKFLYHKYGPLFYLKTRRMHHELGMRHCRENGEKIGVIYHNIMITIIFLLFRLGRFEDLVLKFLVKKLGWVKP